MTTTVNNEHKNIKVPNLRFKEFQGEWEKYELNDICETITDFVAAGSFASLRENVTYYQEDNYAQLVRTIDLKNNFSNNEFVYVDKGAYDFLWRVQLIEPNIVLPNIGANIGEKYYVRPQNLPKDKNVLGPNAILLRSESNDTHFVYFRLSTSSYDNEMKKLVGASGQPKFNKTDLKKVKVFMPTISEQKKISRFLALIDERIATQNKIIDKLQSLIKGIADKLFQTARTTKPLLEFAPNITSGTDKSGSGTIPLYGSTGIIGTVKNASQKGNIVLVARVGTIGTVQYVNEPCGVSDNALIVEAGEMTKYIYHFLKTYNFTRITSGTTQPLITASSLKKAAIPTYDIESQTRIVLCLNGLEKKLDMAKQYLSDIAVMKQYLLRQMFI